MSCLNELRPFESVEGTRVAFGWRCWSSAGSTTGALLEAHDYYPFGQDMIGRSSAGAPVRQGFTGYWRDHEAGLNLYYAGTRQYDPTTGRFFGADPLAEDFPTWSGYTYTLNDPVRWRDPDGRCPVGSQAGDIHDGSVCMQEIVVTAERIGQNNSLYSAIIIGGITADAAIIEPSDMLYLKWSFWGLAYIVASILDVQLQNYAVSFDDVWSISNKTDNPNIRSKRGGLEQAEEDFDSLGLGDVKSIPGGKVGVLPNGDRVVVREKSSDGRPTLEKHSNNSGNHKKIRYD